MATATATATLDELVNSIYRNRKMWMGRTYKWVYPHSEAAEDCLQDALFKATRAWEQRRLDGSPEAWFNTILHNCCREFKRNLRTHVEGHGEDLFLEETFHVPQLSCPSHQMVVIRWVDLNRIADGKRHLMKRQRELLGRLLEEGQGPDPNRSSTPRAMRWRMREQLNRLGVGR